MRVALILLLLWLAPGVRAAEIAPSAARIAPPAAGKEARSLALILAEPERRAEAEALALRLGKVHAMTALIPAEAVPDCAAAGEALAALARAITAQQGVQTGAPVLVGLGPAGGLALAAAAGAPGAFKGLATLDFDGGEALCGPPPASGKAAARWQDVGVAPAAPALAGVRHYPVAPRGPARAAEQAAAEKAAAARRAAQGAPAPAPAADAAPAPTGDVIPDALVRAYIGLAGMDHAFDPGAADEAALTAAGLGDFPITLHLDPAAPPRGAYAIFLSGDGGWADFDREIADRLAAQGVPVVGLSSLRYMWQERRPARLAADMARLDEYFAPRLGASRLLLAGFSLGANVTPFYAPLLPGPMRARLAGIALISPETSTGFEIRVGGWLGRATGAEDVAEAIRAAAAPAPAGAGIATLCLYGTDDRNAACPAASMAGWTRAAGFPGGHHIDKAYDAAAAEIVALIDRTAPTAHAPGPEDGAEARDAAPSPALR